MLARVGRFDPQQLFHLSLSNGSTLNIVENVQIFRTLLLVPYDVYLVQSVNIIIIFFYVWL